MEARTLLSVATVNVASTVRAVPANLLGVNTAPWDGLLTNANTLSLSQSAGIDSIRIGGGSSVDTNIHFNVNNQSNNLGQVATYVANLGATGIVDVNYGEGSPEEAVAEWAYLNGNPSDTTTIASLYGNNAGDAEQWGTSSWTQGVNWQTIGYWATLRANSGSNFLNANHSAFNFTQWEIGNEIYGSWETDEHGKSGDALPMPSGDTLKAHDPATLISFAKQFQTGINEVLADGFEGSASPISIGYDSQSVSSSDFSNWIGNTLTQARIQGFTIGFVADHWYTNDSSGNESDSGLLAVSNSAAGASVSGLSSYTSTSNPYNWATRASDYDALFKADAPGQNIQLIADEVNSIPSTPGKQMTSLVNGLFVADALGSVLNTTGSNGLGGYEGVDLWDLHNGPVGGNSSSSLYGWRTSGDYGILGNGQNGAPTDGTNEPYPDYYALQLASKFILPGGTVVSATEDNELNIDTYAIKEANGNLELLVVNKTNPGTTPPNNSTNIPTLTEQFDISGFNANSQATVYQYGIAQDDAQDNATNDTTSLVTSSVNLGISGGDFSYAVQDYSMSVFVLTPGLGVAQAAAANPSPVTGTTTTLSALGSENGSSAGLNYTWLATSVPGGVATPTYSANGTNGASSTIATFYGAGNYTFKVTISDASSNSVTSTVNVTVNQTLTSIEVNPSSITLNEDTNQQFTATAEDQFDANMASQPSFDWSLSSGIGGVTSAGLYTSPAASGSATVEASSGSVLGTASVTIDNAAPTVAQAAAANANPVTGTSTALSVLGADDGGESNLTYLWSDTGPGNLSYSGTTNGTNAAKDITANFTQAGNYNFTVTITDSGGLFTTSSVAVTVEQTPTGVVVSPSSPTIAVGGMEQFSATASDQFGNAIGSPTFGWSIGGSGNSIDATGLVTLGSTPGTYTVTATLGAASGTASITGVASTAPVVNLFQVNDGNVQRAMVDSVTLVFSEPVALDSGALALNQRSTTGGSATPMTYALSSADGGTSWVLTFSDPSYIGGSLPDGTYDLTVTGADVTGAGNTPMAGNPIYSFYRLYGDFLGTGSANGSDFSLLASVFGKSVSVAAGNWYIDYYGTGQVNGSDFSQFAARFGKSASFTPAIAQASATAALTENTLTEKASAVLKTTAPPLHHKASNKSRRDHHS
jgi:hypothetical protein